MYLRYCFVENLYRSKIIEPSEFAVLSQWFEFVVNSEDLDLEVDLVIYLRTEPEKVRLTVKRFFFFFFSVGTPTNILH